MVVVVGLQNNSGGGYKSVVRTFERLTNEETDWKYMATISNTDERDGFFPKSIALSEDGLTLAIASPENGTNGYRSGRVRCYFRESSQAKSWQKFGKDFFGVGPRGLFGYGLSLSADGTVIAISAPYTWGGCEICHAYVQTFKREDKESFNWKAIGGSLKSNIFGDKFGLSLDLSGNGMLLVVGVPNAAPGGRIKTYYRNSKYDKWLKYSDDLEGEELDSLFGTSVVLSSDGISLAIGQAVPLLGDTSGDKNGYVHIYRFNELMSQQKNPWRKIASIAVEDVVDVPIIAVNSDGSEIAVGDSYKTVRAYKISGENIDNPVVQIGNDLFSDGSNSFGYSIAMSGDSSLLVVGNPLSSKKVGNVRMYLT